MSSPETCVPPRSGGVLEEAGQAGRGFTECSPFIPNYEVSRLEGSLPPSSVAVGRKGRAEEAGQVPGGLALRMLEETQRSQTSSPLKMDPWGLAAYSKALELGAGTSRVEPCIELGPCSLFVYSSSAI